MKTSKNIELAVKELAIANFKMYPESYPLNEDGTATDEASEAVADLASNYFDNRTEIEIEEQEALNITEIDYVEWCMAAFSNLIEGLTRITEHDETGYEWLVGVCEYIDNQEALEAALEGIGAYYEIIDRNLYASVSDVKEADIYAFEKAKEISE